MDQLTIVPGVRGGGCDGLLQYGFPINLATVTGLDVVVYGRCTGIVSCATQSTGSISTAFRVIRRNYPYCKSTRIGHFLRGFSHSH